MQNDVRQMTSHLAEGDATQDEQRGPVWEARTSIPATKTPFSYINFPLSIEVATELRTSQRRAITCFLSPLSRYADGSLREG